MRQATTAALLAALMLLPAAATAAPSSTPFAIMPGSFAVTPSTEKAGAHADLSIAFDFSHNAEGETFNDVRTVSFELPPGFIGNATSVPACTEAQLLGPELKPECPPGSQVGTISFKGSLAGNLSVMSAEPLFNMNPSRPGVPAELAFRSLIATQNLPLVVRPQDSRLVLNSPDLDVLAEPHDVSIALWGVPAESSHDPERGHECFSLNSEPECHGGGESANEQPRPFLSNPTSCGPSVAAIRADSWEDPEEWSQASAEAGPIVDCEGVPFDPVIEARPSSDSAESPSGFAVSLRVPQTPGDPSSTSTSALKGASFILPEGLSLNPSFAPGLGTCAPAQLRHETATSAPGEGCPKDAKIGTVEVATPILSELATGSIFLAEPFDNPTHSRFAAYLLVKAPARGLLIELAILLKADPVTGRLTISFEEGPQLPLSRLTLGFDGGQTAPFATPATCGAYEVRAELTPWSAPAEPRALAGPFAIDKGGGGVPCPAGQGTFHPELSAAPRSNVAGAFTPLDIRLSRKDGEAKLSRFSIELPPGLFGSLAGIPLCPDAAIAAARGGTGAEEREHPSCPAASELGHTLIEAGVGTALAQAPGKIYLAGPYQGAPLSLALLTPMLLGPFDLGTVVTRATFRIDPRSDGILLESPAAEPLPQVLGGIPLHLRDLRIHLDRPRFIRNPTSCRRKWVRATVTGLAAGEVERARVASPFQPTDCHRLGFAPSLRLTAFGGVHRNGHPGVRAVLASHSGEAGLSRATIFMPGSELLDVGHIRRTCEPQELEADRCPAASLYGHAKATSPILSEPLRGPVFLYTDPESRLPDLVAALRSRKVDFNLTGRLRLRAGSIEVKLGSVPDVPISKFVLEGEGGGKGLLVNSVDLCGHPQRIRARLLARNGKVENLRPPLAAACSGGPAERGRRAPDRSGG
jgi:hypothetical protein